MLTMKKRLYAQGRVEGKNQTDAARFAGCPEPTARQAASRYEKDAEVQACIARLRAGLPEPTPEPKVKITPEPTRKIEKEAAMLRKAVQKRAPTVAQVAARVPLELAPHQIEDPLEFMRAVMADANEDPKLRLDAAKALASFTCAKPGEKGKKDEQQEKAKNAAGGKFAAAATPPTLLRKVA